MAIDLPTGASMGELLAALRAVAETTRLRLLVLCARGELTVSELAQILGQSQPRVSRHLKLLCEAGLLDRFREGSWVFYRLSSGSAASALSRHLVAAFGKADETIALDLQRLAAIKRQRAELAAAYFSENAVQWHRIRSLYIDETEVEAALSEVIQAAGPRDLLDIGTGTGRMLEILGPQVGHALGIDQSREMLAVARVNLERAGLANSIVRLGDMYQLPLADACFDAVVIHQVLHYADRPSAAIAEAARVLRPNGILLCRLNSTKDRHFGAIGHKSIAENFYLVRGAPKRFFDLKSINDLFADGEGLVRIAQGACGAIAPRRRLMRG
jgi:ArsR family transcriptional regulator